MSDPLLSAEVLVARSKCGDDDGVWRECQRLIFADVGYADAGKMPTVVAMSESDQTALLVVVDKTLRRHPELAPKPGQ